MAEEEKGREEWEKNKRRREVIGRTWGRTGGGLGGTGGGLGEEDRRRSRVEGS